MGFPPAETPGRSDIEGTQYLAGGIDTAACAVHAIRGMHQPEENFGLGIELQVVIAGKMLGGIPVIRYRKMNVIERVGQFFRTALVKATITPTSGSFQCWCEMSP